MPLLHLLSGITRSLYTTAPAAFLLFPPSLPSYCGTSDPTCVAKCLSTGKWFCNGRINSHGSCLVVHLVKNRAREVQLHKDSNLGDVVLECYATYNRNVFSLGFVPVRGDNTAVLLARDLPVNNPVVRELGVEMSQVGLG
jgi:regulator of nonsense transcripts 1